MARLLEIRTTRTLHLGAVEREEGYVVARIKLRDTQDQAALEQRFAADGLELVDVSTRFLNLDAPLPGQRGPAAEDLQRIVGIGQVTAQQLIVNEGVDSLARLRELIEEDAEGLAERLRGVSRGELDDWTQQIERLED